MSAREDADNVIRKSASGSNSDLSQKSSSEPKIMLIPSDYDAFDLGSEAVDPEEDIGSQEGLDDDDNDGQAIIHSDFRSLELSDTDPEFFDTSWSFVDTADPEEEESMAELSLVMENERKDEVSVAPFRSTAFPPIMTQMSTACR